MFICIILSNTYNNIKNKSYKPIWVYPLRLHIYQLFFYKLFVFLLFCENDSLQKKKKIFSEFLLVVLT